MRYRLPFALAAVKGQARWRGSRRSPLTAFSLREFSNYERLRASLRQPRRIRTELMAKVPLTKSHSPLHWRVKSAFSER